MILSPVFKYFKRKCRFQFFLGMVLGAIGLIAIVVVIFLFQDWRNEKLWEEAIYNEEPPEEEEIQQVSEITVSSASEGTGENKDFQRELIYQEASSDNTKIILMYQMPFHPGLNDHYYDYLSSQYFIAVKEVETDRERYIFVGDYKTGFPHWLDNEYIYFTAGCGTSCQSLYLVNTRNQESRLALLGYIRPDNENISWQTHFSDWFDQEFRFGGLVDEIKTEVIARKVYLVFKMEDGEGNSIGEKRFLFTGEELKE